MTRIFEQQGSYFDRDSFNRTVSKTGWSKPSNGWNNDPSLTLGCLTHQLHKLGVTSAEATVKGAYSSICYSTVNGDRFNVVSFSGDPVSDDQSEFGLTVTYDWVKIYRGSKSVPLNIVEEAMNEFQEMVDASLVACGFEPARWA